MMAGGKNTLAKSLPLKGYQKSAVDWAMCRLYGLDREGVGIFLDPGMGKTRITLTVLETLFDMGEIKRVLIVAPLRPVYFVWPDEIRKWGFGFSHIVLHNQHATAMRENCQIEIVNYEGLVKLAGVKYRWDVVVFDESTKLKNWSRKRTKAARSVAANIPKRLILTGTPAANSLADLHSQMWFVDGGEALGKTVTYFRQRYMQQGGYQGRQWILRPHCKKELLDLVSDKALRLQLEDHVDMPALVTNDIWCTLEPTEQKLYNKLKRDLAIELESGNVSAASAAAAYGKCKQFAAGTVYQVDEMGERSSHKAHDHKIEALRDLYEELGGKPLLVFYTYTQDLERFRHHREFKKAPAIRGKNDAGKKMTMKEVESILTKWNKGETPILFCQWEAASHGLNMQEACNDVACFGVPESPETYDQAFRRVYRTGVKGSQVRIHRLLTRNTVDEVILNRLIGKTKTQDEFLQALKIHAKS